MNDFCDKHEDALPARSSFMRELIRKYEQARPEERNQKLKESCSSQLSTNRLLNTWFDPIDPLGRLTADKICDTQYNIIENQS